MRFKLITLLAATSLLAACSHKAEEATVATTAATTPTTAPTATLSLADELKTQVGDRVFFDYNQSVISAEGKSTLTRQAAFAAKHPELAFTVEGHCDERGTREYNLALGERRGTAAKNALVAAGVSASRLSTISYGKERPAVEGSTETAWAQNRRAVTVIN